MFPIEESVAANALSHPQQLPDPFNWVFWILMALNVIFFAAVRTFSPGYFVSLVTTGLFNRQLVQNSQEELRLFGTGSMLLNFSYFNCIAITASRLVNQEVNTDTFIFLGVLILFAGIKLLTMQFLIFASRNPDGIHEHLLNHFVYFQIAALVMTPLFIFTYFIGEQLNLLITSISVICVAIFILLREVQTLLRAARKRIGLLYIILYLCTLELLPFVLLMKVFVLQ